MSSESIASPHSPVGSPEPCRGCGAPLADDQRYCLECGERRTPMSSVLLGGPPATSEPSREPPSAPPGLPGADGDGAGRGSAVTVIAGVGVLLLAMGVGVLIGRSGGGKQTASAPAQVITVQGAGTGTSAGAGEPATFTDDWPSGTSGYTVQLRTLPVAGTQVSAVEAAKSSSSAKGAQAVGALKSEDFSSLPAGSYVIYSGVYHKRAEAQKAVPALKKSFPSAAVVKVSSGEAAGGSSSPSSKAGASGAGSSPSNPAPPTVLNKLKQLGGKGPSSGKTYEQESKKLPDVVETG
ncbi:MAG TPA: hypothetical protein VGX69_04975 [Solirubrobacteraceae bacterium]|nr:hypothetical protein [Solirubrobacteraceae bacterium]